MLASWAGYGHCQRCGGYYEATAAFDLGEYIGNIGHMSGGDTIHSPDLDDLAFGTCREFEHTHDVDTDSREFCVVCELGR